MDLSSDVQQELNSEEVFLKNFKRYYCHVCTVNDEQK